jgi:hypothetical protein
MHDVERVEMLETKGNLARGALRVEGVGDLGELVRPFDKVRKRGRAQFKNYVMEVSISLLVKITNDVWVPMAICKLEKADFPFGEGNILSDETFDGHCAALK